VTAAKEVVDGTLGLGAGKGWAGGSSGAAALLLPGAGLVLPCAGLLLLVGVVGFSPQLMVSTSAHKEGMRIFFMVIILWLGLEKLIQNNFTLR
jgi:hypothetical protein